jgi:hypothetical protein
MQQGAEEFGELLWGGENCLTEVGPRRPCYGEEMFFFPLSPLPLTLLPFHFASTMRGYLMQLGNGSSHDRKDRGHR